MHSIKKLLLSPHSVYSGFYFFFLLIASRVSVDVVLIAHFPVSLSFKMCLAPALLHAHAGGEHVRNKPLQRLGE